MDMQRIFPRGIEYSNEGFVQQSIEAHFDSLGYEVEAHDATDLYCVHPDTHETWHVEAKGFTTAVGLDFRTGLGQLVQRMNNETTCYGLAVPNMPQFLAQCRLLKPWVRKNLHLYWLIVTGDGIVQVISPDLII